MKSLNELLDESRERGKIRFTERKEIESRSLSVRLEVGRAKEEIGQHSMGAVTSEALRPPSARSTRSTRRSRRSSTCATSSSRSPSRALASGRTPAAHNPPPMSSRVTEGSSAFMSDLPLPTIALRFCPRSLKNSRAHDRSPRMGSPWRSPVLAGPERGRNEGLPGLEGARRPDVRRLRRGIRVT
jgi:hypothetical protein